jgi:hypothetical protein
MSTHSVPLPSSTLTQADYDSDQTRLRLVFRDGSRYAYSSVPPHLFFALLGAPSQGTFFNRYIRGQFPHAKITDEN